MTLERNGVRVFVDMAYGKPWAYIETTRGPAPYSFRDQFDMIRAVGRCEVLKYTARNGGDPESREAWEVWTGLPRLFLDACWAWDADYTRLAPKFGLPR